MAAEGPVQEIPEFIREIFYPSPLPSFRESMPSGEIEVHLHRRPAEEPTRIRLTNMFPFMTLQDIKTAICTQLPKELNVVPEFLYLCMYGSQPGKQFLGGMVAPVDFSWNFPSSSATNPFRVAEPFKLMASPDMDIRFVDSGGDRKLVSLVDRERLTIEDAFFKKGVAQGIPILHAYLYADLVGSIPGAKPPSERDWNGRLYPLFPQLSSRSVEPSAEQRAAAQRAALIFTRRQQFLVRIESILERDIPLVPLTMAGVKYMQLIWDAKKKTPGIETHFYEAVVTERRPFIRFIPTEGGGLSKVFLKEGDVPDIQDPNLLVQWSQDRSPTPEQDFAFAKIMLRKGLANVPPIYATLQLFNDGTASCVVEPPKGVKKLEPRNDLESFGEHLVEGLQNLPYIDTMPEIGKGIFVLGLHVKKGSEAVITPRILRERLPIFSSMFQEISPLPGEKPMAMLRFKLVSNFAREDRIQTFLSQVIQRKVLRGDSIVTDLVDIVAEEFQIDYDEARKQVARKLQSQGEISLIVPETKEYMRQNNPGIDIAIFAQHPFYTFHLYNVNSLENLRRIVTALSVMMSVGSDELQVGVKAVQELAKAEAFVAKEEEEEQEQEGEVEEGAVPAPAPAPDAPDAPAAPAPAVEEAEEEGGAEDMPDYLDFFAYDQETAEMTLEQANAAEEAAAAQKLEGQARPEPPLADEGAAQPRREPGRKLGEAVAAAAVAPKDELEGLAPVAKAEEEPEHTGETGIANYFLNKLKEADSRLFDYAKSNPSLKRYVSQCQPTYGRQPAVLSEEKFVEMQEEYAKDNITFQVFPLQPGEPVKPPGVAEQDYFTVLKYGSSPQRQNYYLCSKYFCTRDEILVRESDLAGTEMRRPYRRADGSTSTAKNPGECPFCRGRVIKSRRSPAAGETIMERVIKPPTQDKRHLFINFINKTPHPEGFYLPCCFTEEVPIKYKGNPAFDKYREWGANVRPLNAAGAEGLEPELAPPVAEGRTMIAYFTTLSQVAKKYIVGAEKLPLDIGSVTSGSRGEAQIGLLPTSLNAYFDQDPTNIVTRAFNPQKIKPGGTGFLRIAVENRHRYQNDSFLAAVAPFYGKNSASEMKEHIIGALHPREFLAANYGNLAIEFYDPTSNAVVRPAQPALTRWASDFLQVDRSQENEEALMRAYLSYHAFQTWLLSDGVKKEYRQFALLFAQSNALRRAHPVGITFIVLDILKDDTVKARCPPYGFNAGLMSKNDVAFIMHHWSGIWEPIFHVDNRAEEERDDLFTLEFQYAGRSVWPPIVQKRLGEFMTQCSSPGRGAYTSHSKIHPLAMIPASFVKSVLEKDPEIIFDGVIRDAYNHIGGLTFRSRKDETGRVAIIPVVDDGELIDGKNLYLDWDDAALKPIPVDQMMAFYTRYIVTRFAYYPGFSPTYIVKQKESEEIVALQLRNGLYVPVIPPTTEGGIKVIEGSPTRMVAEMEWRKNKDISLKEGDDGKEMPDEKERMSVAEFQEIFEHLRLTFSNWLAGIEDGGEFRSRLEGVIFSHRLPLAEKRKRMEILLKREVDKWITTDFADEDDTNTREVSLLRVDCRVKGQEECGGRCVWKQEADKCLLHVPEETRLGEQNKEQAVSASRVLLLRLIEELLRYGERRRQLLDQDVNRLATLDKPVRIPEMRCLVCKKFEKDHKGETHTFKKDPAAQVIYPEKSAAWYDLLRLEWAAKPEEKPLFLEEMGRPDGDGVLAPQDESTALPPALVTVLNGASPDPKTGAIRLLRTSYEGLLVPLRLTTEEIEIPEEAEILDDRMLNRIVRKTGGNVFQIDIREDPPVFSGAKPIRLAYEGMPIPVFVVTSEGPGLLVLNPAAPQILKRDNMPAGLLEVLDSTLASKKGIIGMNIKPKAAVAAPPPAPRLLPRPADAAPPPPVAAPPPPPPADPLADLKAQQAREANLLFPPIPASATAGKTIAELRAERFKSAQAPAPQPAPPASAPPAFPPPPPPAGSV